MFPSSPGWVYIVITAGFPQNLTQSTSSGSFFFLLKKTCVSSSFKLLIITILFQTIKEIKLQ